MGSSYILINGLRVHYLRWVSMEEKCALVLVHGLASNARIWEWVAPLLAERGFTCYAPDGRGHGLTDKPESGYDFMTMTRDLASFIETCEIERPLLVGHSWGASIVLNYAAQMNAGIRAPRGIVLVDGGIVQMSDQPGLTWEIARERLKPPKLAGLNVDEFLDRISNWTSEWDPNHSIHPIVLASFDIADDDTISPRLTFERHMLIVRSIWEFKTYEVFKRIRCPVLIVPARPKHPMSALEKEYLEAKENGAQEATAAIQQVKIHWMADSVHDIPLQHPTALADQIAEFATDLIYQTPLNVSNSTNFYLRNAQAEDSLKIKSLIFQVGINPMDLNWSHFVIALSKNEEFLGCGQVKKHRDGSLELASIAVKPEWRNLGIASKIIEHLIRAYPHPLYLTCRKKLGGFYEKFGFHIVEMDEMPPYFHRIARLAKLLGGLKLIPGDLLIMKLDP